MSEQSTTSPMAHQKVAIIGAGISGLVLGRCLLNRGIPAILYEKNSKSQFGKRHNYGISLNASSIRPLLQILDIDEASFKRKIAVDSSIGGTGCISTTNGSEKAFRANRNKFERLLCDGLDVRWEHAFDKCDSNNHSPDFKLKVHFDNSHMEESTLLVGAEGPHSTVRKAIAPATDFEILPYVVINGKRRVDSSTFDSRYAAKLNEANVIEQRIGNVLLQISINDRTGTEVSISYTYSRPARQSSDPVFKPSRPKSGATEIPQELFDEVNALKDLPEPFNDVFDDEKMKKDRLLNWLMRTVLAPKELLQDAAKTGVTLVGDAAHHEPILGSEGANEAIEDAMALADCMASEDANSLRVYAENRYETWASYVKEGKDRLESMHGAMSAHL